MGQARSEDAHPPRLSSESNRSNSSIQTYAQAARSSSERSPQKSFGSEGVTDSLHRSPSIQELIARLNREEKIRDAAGALLAELNYGQKQPHKAHGNVIKQLNNSLKSDSQQKKKVKAQFDAADRQVQLLRERLHELGIDEDDDLSSEDEDGPSGGASMLFAEDYSMNEDDSKYSNHTAYHQLGMVSSAASSAADLPSFATITRDTDHQETASTGNLNAENSKMAADTAVRHIRSLLEALEPRSSDANMAVDRLSELILTVPGVSAELRRQAPWDLCSNVIRPFMLDKNPLTLGLGLRLLRMLSVDANAVTYFRSSLLLDIIIPQILSKDDHDKNHQMRLHATQLVRAIVNVPGGVSELSQSVCRALVAVAEQSNDDIRHISIETLSELMVIDAEKVFEAGGAKVLMNTMIEPLARKRSDKHDQESFALALAMAFAGAADSPEIRQKYLRNGRDLSWLLTNFTDAQLYGFIRPSKDQLHSSAMVMQTFLRSWIGISCFDLELFVHCLTVPTAEIQETLLVVLDNVLWVPPSPEKISYNKTSANNVEPLSHQFTAILLDKLQRCGLQERIVLLQTEGVTEHIRKKAQYIGSKIFLLSAKLVPRHEVIKKSMLIPQKVSYSLAKTAPFSLPTASVALFGSEAELKKTTVWQNEPNLQTFVRFGIAMDDVSFKKLVHMSRVLETKLFRQWNWDALMELVQGPLRSPKRLDEVARGSKFLKRLLTFYRPFKYRFSNLTITREHIRYVEVGKELMKSLLDTEEGVYCLEKTNNKLFKQIAECFAQLDPLSGIVSTEPLFSIRRYRSTLCCAYSELIGVLSSSADGQRILADSRIFNMFYRACEINDREDVVRSIICALDYRLEGHPRLILAKALTAPSRGTRLFVTEFIGSQLATPEPNLWAIDLMVEQLYDSEASVAIAATHGLHNMCAASKQAMDYLISLKPFLGHVNEAAEPLRILFMSRPKGFDLLISELEGRDMSQWAPSFNEAYVDKIEIYLASVNVVGMMPTEMQSGDDIHSTRLSLEPFKFPHYSRPLKKNHQSVKLTPPVHFFGELAFTEQGCRFLKSKGALDELSAIIKSAAKSVDQRWSLDEMRKIKGALWAVGNVASRQKGALLLDMALTEDICLLCKRTEVYSIRGTAFYALGLFALSRSGAELLHQCGWNVVYDVHSQPVGVALPPDSYYEKIDSSVEQRKNRISKIIFPPQRIGTSYLESSDALSNRKTSISSATDSYVQGLDTAANNSASSSRSQSAVALSIDPGNSARPPETIAKSTSPVKAVAKSRSLSILPRIDTSRGSRAPSVNDDDRDRPPPILPPSISSMSLLSPASAASSHNFDFEVDSDISHRRSSCLDLLEFPQRRDETAERVIQAVNQLGSYVLAQSASKKLVSLRGSHPDIFRSGETLKEVMKVLASGHYKQVTRRFIFELFDIAACLEKLYYRRARLAMKEVN